MEHRTHVDDFDVGEYERLWLDVDDGMEQTG